MTRLKSPPDILMALLIVITSTNNNTTTHCFSVFFILSLIVNGVSCTVSVMEGDSVTLHTGLTDIQKDDFIEWRFGNKMDLIALIIRVANEISVFNGTDERFTDRLKMNPQSGDLTITHITSELTGVYKLDIIRQTTTTKTFNVSGVFGDTGGVKQVSVMDGDSVTLHTDVSDTQRYDEILWLFEPGNTTIAHINRAAQFLFLNDTDEKRILHKLHLDHQKGDLTIRNVRPGMSGLYQVHIISRTYTIHKRFNITVCDGIHSVSVMEGDSVTLYTEDDERDDVLVWTSDTFTAEMDKKAYTVYTYADRRFMNRLQVNNHSGSLTITNISTTEAGLYSLEMSDSRCTLHRIFIITVCDGVKTLEVKEGEPVVLKDRVGTFNQLQWRAGFTFMAHLNKTGQSKVTHDEGFRDRLHLDHETGDLTIRDTTTKDSGVYHLEINSDRHTLVKKFHLIVHAQRYAFNVGYFVSAAVCLMMLMLVVVLVMVIYRCQELARLRQVQKKKLTSAKRKTSLYDSKAPMEMDFFN